jgi:hypothetical protein
VGSPAARPATLSCARARGPPAWSAGGPTAAWVGHSPDSGRWSDEEWSADHRPRTRLKMKTATATMTSITRMVHNMVSSVPCLSQAKESRVQGWLRIPTPSRTRAEALPPVPHRHQNLSSSAGGETPFRRPPVGHIRDRCVQRLAECVEWAEHVARPGDLQESEHGCASPYGRTEMIVLPLTRSVGLKAATASSRVAILPMLVRSRPSSTRCTISPS